MKMFIGGSFQGKKKFASEKTGIEIRNFVDGSDCNKEDIFSAKVLCHFHEYVKRQMKAGDDCSTLAEEIIRQNPDIMIITNEIGYGVVPMEAFDRAYRENTGRICCKLADYSSEVWRVCCGIGTCIKKTGE